VNQPPVVRGDDVYLFAFSCLGTERQFPGNGIGPIPWSAAFDYAARSCGFDRLMSTYFATVILMLDGHYREHLVEERKKESDREARRARRKAKAEGTGGKMSGLERRRATRSARK